jgi:hypothetical protein
MKKNDQKPAEKFLTMYFTKAIRLVGGTGIDE